MKDQQAINNTIVDNVLRGVLGVISWHFFAFKLYLNLIFKTRGVVRAFSKGGRGGKNLGPKGDAVQGKGCPLLLGRKIFDFLTSLDAFSGHFLTIFGLWGLAQGGPPPPGPRL